MRHFECRNETGTVKGQLAKSVWIIFLTRSLFGVEVENLVLSKEYTRQSPQATIEEIAALPADAWRPLEAQASFGYTEDAIWTRLQLQNLSQESRFILELRYAGLDLVELYQKENDRFVVRRTGDRLPRSQRAIRHRLPALPLTIAPAGKSTVYLKVKSSSTVILPLKIYSPEEFARTKDRDTMLLGLFFGLLLVMASYNLFLAGLLRSLAYLYYVLYIILFSCFQLADQGIGALYLWPENFLLPQNELVPAIIGSTMMFALLFTHRFLRLREFHRRASQVVRLLTVYAGIAALTTALLPYRIAIALNMLSALTLPLAVIPSGFICMRKGFRPAGYFLAAWFMLVIAIAYRVLLNTGVVSPGILSEYSIQIASAAEVLLLSMALGQRMNFAEKERLRLQREALEQEQKLNQRLREIDSLKDEFLASTSHELRTPLHGITGLVQSVLNGVTGPVTDKTREHLELVVASGRRLNSLIHDILDFSHLRHGEIQLRLQSIPLQTILENVAILSRPMLKAGVHLQVDCPANLAVEADHDRLEQILFNLLGNAVKFTAQGRITVSARQEGENILIAVEDTGCGIAAEKQERIFESFTQADSTIATQFGGTGLGLAIVRKLLELHQTRIELHSEVDKGSVFSFVLPQARAQPPIASMVLPLENSAAPDPAKSARPQQPSGGPVALVVDDDPTNRLILTDFLSLDNWSVVSVDNGQEALHCLEESLPDLVLLDIMMPGLSGYEVCRKIRAMHSPTELPVIMLTARSQLEDLLEGFETGANDYLRKPFDARELRARVRTMLAIKNSALLQSEYASLQQELEIAWRIQQSLLPGKLPELPGVAIAARYLAMAAVGGDFYDIARLPDGNLGFLIADVSGHGVPAALVVSVFKMAFTVQKEFPQTPGQLFENLNNILIGNTGGEFITASFAALDPNSLQLWVVNAGHPSLLVHRRRTAAIIELRPHGRILGCFDSAHFQVETLQLQPGDRIIQYTDGLTEARQDGVLFATRLKDRLLELSDVPVDRLLDQLIEEVTEWSGGREKIHDDVAMLAFEITEAPPQDQER